MTFDEMCVLGVNRRSIKSSNSKS